MKTSLLSFVAVTILGTTVMAAPQAWTFTYKPKAKDSFTLTLQADSKQEAFKVASKACFQKLTNGEYPGEAKGLDYIDICANPKM